MKLIGSQYTLVGSWKRGQAQEGHYGRANRILVEFHGSRICASNGLDGRRSCKGKGRKLYEGRPEPPIRRITYFGTVFQGEPRHLDQVSAWYGSEILDGG